VAILIIRGLYLTINLIGFRSDLVAVSNPAFLYEHMRYLYIVHM